MPTISIKVRGYPTAGASAGSQSAHTHCRTGPHLPKPHSDGHEVEAKIIMGPCHLHKLVCKEVLWTPRPWILKRPQQEGCSLLTDVKPPSVQAKAGARRPVASLGWGLAES